MRTPGVPSLITSLLVLALVGCGPASSPSAGKPAEKTSSEPKTSATVAPAAKASGGSTTQFVIGSLEEPGNLSALSTLPHHFPEHTPLTLMYDSLVQLLPDGQFAPRLAESWDVSPDGLNYTFKLTDKARWWDGQPVVADDVKFTIDSALKPETQSSTEGLDQVANVETPDQRTVKVTLKRMVPTFLAQGGSRGIVPKHVLDGQDLAKSEFNRRPLGSGPFKFVSWTPAQAIVMEANEEYFQGKPSFQRVVFKILPDQNVMLTQLRSGELSYAHATPKDLKAIEGMSGLAVHEVPTLRFFDMAPNYERPYFADPKVRLALLHGINRQGIVDGVLLGHGAVIESNVTPTSWAYNPDLPKRSYDKERAQQLLSEAGWSRGSDGILQKGGDKLQFGVMINSYDRVLEQALVVAQQNLKDVGVDLTIDRVEPGVFGSRRTKKEFDALARVWNPVYDPDQAGLIRTGNFYGYSNPEADKLAMDGLMTADQSARRPIYQQLQGVLHADVARLWLYTENELHAMSAKVSGVQGHPVNFFWNLREWKAE